MRRSRERKKGLQTPNQEIISKIHYMLGWVVSLKKINPTCKYDVDCTMFIVYRISLDRLYTVFIY